MTPHITLTGYIKKAELAQRLGVSPRTINKMMQRKVIPFYRLGGLRLFKLTEVEAAMERYRVDAVGGAK
jgi:excisionase family DNA binding protein